jgi:hypothetical protein
MRETRVTIPGVKSDNVGERDNGKTFVIKEMTAYAGQDWALRLLLALAASGVQLPEGALTTGMAGLAQFGLTALLQAPYAAIKPLLDELLDHVGYEHKEGQPLQRVKPDSAGNCPVREIKTYLTLYKAAFSHQMGFSAGAAPPT